MTNEGNSKLDNERKKKKKKKKKFEIFLGRGRCLLTRTNFYPANWLSASCTLFPSKWRNVIAEEFRSFNSAEKFLAEKI